MTPEIKPIVEKNLRLMLGANILGMAEWEETTMQDAMSLGLMDYFRCQPYIIRTFEYISGVNTPSRVVPFEQILARIPEGHRKYAYFLGIVRTDVAIGTFNLGLYSFDQFLMGFNVGTQSNQSIFDPLKQVAMNSISDLVTGEVEYEIDRVNNQVNFTFPVTIGQCVVDYAIGFQDRWEYVKPNHTEFLAKLCAVKFLNSIITSRTASTLTADFTVDTSALQKTVDRLEEELKKDKLHYRRLPMLWS